MIHSFLSEYFPDSQLDPINSFITHDIHLRFELGDGLENGTSMRVDHCVKKAATIFDHVFHNDDEIYMLVKHCQYDGAKEFYEHTEGYLESQILNFDALKTLDKSSTTSETDNFYDPAQGESTLQTVATLHTQRTFPIDLKQTNYKNIFRGIANLEMGISPAISSTIYFINKSKKIVFYMYDDRGCMVYASNLESIRHLYNDFHHWLVPYHIETFDNLFLSFNF